MNALLRSGIVTLAGTVGAGMIVLGSGSTASAEEAYAKREDTAQEWVVATDDDLDDDTNTGTNTGTNSRSKDNTGSRKTGVSRDRDRSRGDLSRDWTRDGGDRTRDFSGNHTNDRSRNDTR
jgi:hypothetical protein